MEINDLTQTVINSAVAVKRSLGTGFLENVYQNALALELEQQGLIVEKEKAINVYYKNVIVGHYRADLLVNGVLIVEIKAVDSIIINHEFQLVNYLRATGIDNGLIINFGSERIGIKRKFRLNPNNRPKS